MLPASKSRPPKGSRGTSSGLRSGITPARKEYAWGVPARLPSQLLSRPKFEAFGIAYVSLMDEREIAHLVRRKARRSFMSSIRRMSSAGDGSKPKRR